VTAHHPPRPHATAAGVLGLIEEKRRLDALVSAKVAALFPVGFPVRVPKAYPCGGMVGVVSGYLANQADAVRVTVERSEDGRTPLPFTVDVLAKDLIYANQG